MCQNCKLEKENPAQYKLRMAWLNHALYEEFFQRQGRVEMQEFHKHKRLKIEREMKG